MIFQPFFKKYLIEELILFQLKILKIWKKKMSAIDFSDVAYLDQ